MPAGDEIEIEQETEFSSIWYKEWFNRDYQRLYEQRNSQEAGEFIKSLVDRGLINQGEATLDLACGAGRHLRILREKGYDVWGLDLSPYMLSKAQKSHTFTDKLIRGDIRCLPFRPHFDLVLNLFTSFGYFDDEGNLQALREANRVLKKEGRIIVDYFNYEYTLNHLVPNSSRRIEEKTFDEERRFDEKSQRIIKKITVKEGKSSSVYYESLRCYSLSEFRKLFERAGFAVTEVYGDYKCGELTNQFPRMIMIGDKIGHYSLP